MLWENTAYCVKFSGKDLPRYSNQIESVGLRKCPYYWPRRPRRWRHNNKRFSELAPHHGGKQHRYGMGKLRYCHLCNGIWGTK